MRASDGCSKAAILHARHGRRLHLAPHPAVTPRTFIRRRFRDAIYTDWTCGDWSEVFWATPTLTHLDNKKKRAGAAVGALIRFQWGDCDSSITSSSKTRGHVAHLPRIHLPPHHGNEPGASLPVCLMQIEFCFVFFCFPFSFFAHPHFQCYIIFICSRACQI